MVLVKYNDDIKGYSSSKQIENSEYSSTIYNDYAESIVHPRLMRKITSVNNLCFCSFYL